MTVIGDFTIRTIMNSTQIKKPRVNSLIQELLPITKIPF